MVVLQFMAATPPFLEVGVRGRKDGLGVSAYQEHFESE